MAMEIFNEILKTLFLTFDNQTIWIVLPLFISTLVMLFYFERYREEKPGWNTHVANSLVLVFVSIYLLKYIFEINSAGTLNFVYFPAKLFLSLGVLFIGIIVLFLNFEHTLPEKIANTLSSPLNINLIAYIMILAVYSQTLNLSRIFSLCLIFLLLLLILNVLRIPLRKFFIYLSKLKEKEHVEEIKGDKKNIRKSKQKLKKYEELIKKNKSKLNEKEKNIKQKHKNKIKNLRRQVKKISKVKT